MYKIKKNYAYLILNIFRFFKKIFEFEIFV